MVGPGAHYSIYKHRDELSKALISLERDEIKKKLMGMLPMGMLPPGIDPFRY
jgi:hypothetical protein